MGVDLSTEDHPHRVELDLRRRDWIDEKVAQDVQIWHGYHEPTAWLQHPVKALQGIGNVHLRHVLKNVAGINFRERAILELTQILDVAREIDVRAGLDIEDLPTFSLLFATDMQFHTSAMKGW
jgi:hypothetical protein